MDIAAFHADYDRHPDDRIRLFSAVADLVAPSTVLYPGSYADIAPSVFFDDAIYVDTDKRAARFFAQAGDVERLVASKRADVKRPIKSFRFAFHHLDYRNPLPIPDESVEMLVSLYAGFVSEFCTRYLAPGGWLLANNSHGDVSMASLDSGLELVAVVNSRGSAYRTRTNALDGYLIPKRGPAPTIDVLHDMNRGVAYTKSPFAYIFRKANNL